MSKLLKVIVNTLLLLAILSAGALVIPPFAGITTLVSDGMGNTNISRGAVTYAKKTDTSSVATGEKILVDDNSGKYIYTIQSLDTAAGTASVKNVISGDTTEITVRATVSKVIVTIPVIGFLSMAAQSREGIMIIGLAILFWSFCLSFPRYGNVMKKRRMMKKRKKTRTMRKRPKSFAAERKLPWKKKRNGKNRK